MNKIEHSIKQDFSKWNKIKNTYIYVVIFKEKKDKLSLHVKTYFINESDIFKSSQFALWNVFYMEVSV